MALDWRGEQLRRRIGEAQRRGINRTMAAAVIHAKRNHPWQNRSGTLEGSISIVAYARPEGKRGYRGTWGSKDVEYAIKLELGGAGRRAYPYLRPAADATYRTLPANIRRELRRLP